MYDAYHSLLNKSTSRQCFDHHDCGYIGDGGAWLRVHYTKAMLVLNTSVQVVQLSY